jgi:hypothetical protein
MRARRSLLKVYLNLRTGEKRRRIIKMIRRQVGTSPGQKIGYPGETAN